MTVDEFIERWSRNEGGAERANFPLFLTELCDLLDLPRPDPADATHEHNDYVFERAVSFATKRARPGTAGSISIGAAASFSKPSRAGRKAARRKSRSAPRRKRFPGSTPRRPAADAARIAAGTC